MAASFKSRRIFPLCNSNKCNNGVILTQLPPSVWLDSSKWGKQLHSVQHNSFKLCKQQTLSYTLSVYINETWIQVSQQTIIGWVSCQQRQNTQKWKKSLLRVNIFSILVLIMNNDMITTKISLHNIQIQNTHDIKENTF